MAETRRMLTTGFVGYLRRQCHQYQRNFIILGISFVVFSSYYTLLMPQKCLPVIPLHITQENVYIQGQGQPPVDCGSLFRENNEEVSSLWQYRLCHRKSKYSQPNLLNFAKNCQDFLQYFSLNPINITESELDFPIAFSMLVYKDVEQVFRLLRLIYRPHNYYCVHVDAKSSGVFRITLEAILKCYSNVFIASRSVNVQWGEFSVLEADLTCIRELWQYKKWRYLINLTGQEFPLKTNRELVQILRAYDGYNDIEGIERRRPKYMTAIRFYRSWLPYFLMKESPPDGIRAVKGSTHIIASRGFINYMLFNQTALRLLEWVRDVRIPDEHYFAALNHNYQLGVPGAYKGDPDSKRTNFRLKVWAEDGHICQGKWKRAVCVFGAGDLYRFTNSTQPFMNKFDLEFDPIAYECAEQWYINRTLHEPNPDFDLQFYRNLHDHWAEG